LGKLEAKPAVDEFGQARTRWEYPRHRPRETADGEEKQAAKKDDDIIDTDRALVGRVWYMVKSLSLEEQINLKYKEIMDRARAAAYPDAQARETALISAGIHWTEENKRAYDDARGYLSQLDGWDES
jgi:hypothetical protein